MSIAKTRVLLVDDQAAYREGVRAQLAVVADVEVVGEASDGAEALRKARLVKPTVVLMDLRMPTMDGIEATRHLLREAPACRVIALTTFDDDELVFGALRAGASGYLLKGVETAILVRALRGTEGGSPLSPPVTGKILAEFRRLSAMSPPAAPASSALSPREIEVVKLLAGGATNKDIALALSLAEGTVKNHVTHVLEKLGVGDRTQAALRARDLGLVR
jgi:DNA-binding NarL/FixJ family response regulator